MPPEGDPSSFLDPLHDDFYRGCMHNAAVNETAFRKSDSMVCAALTKTAECGCSTVSEDEDLIDMISPWRLRGCPLGTWSSAFELVENKRETPSRQKNS